MGNVIGYYAKLFAAEVDRGEAFETATTNQRIAHCWICFKDIAAGAGTLYLCGRYHDRRFVCPTCNLLVSDDYRCEKLDRIEQTYPHLN